MKIGKALSKVVENNYDGLSSKKAEILKNIDVIESSSISLVNRTKLLEAQKRIQAEIRSRSKPPKILFKAASTQSEAMKIHYALELLQTQGVNSLKNYFQRMRKEAISKDSSKASRTIMSDSNILEAVAYLKSLTIEHPKIQEIIILTIKLLMQEDVILYYCILYNPRLYSKDKSF